KTALEIGCGVGRMTAAFAQEFGEVIGIDVSPEMVKKARARELPGARFLVGSGCDLSGVEDRSADFAFSYIVFQHIPEKAVILRYFEEAARVLRPGGLFRFHVNGLPHVELGSLLIEGYLSTSPRIPRLLHNKIPLARRRRLDSWWGHPVSLRSIRATCARSGLEIAAVTGRWTAEMWVGGRKRG
ncbi:MAG TPA: class I SAM-dependent methyltransferase, partial [Candidatus Acidoferrales bacterium]|nr:class I SAM-dependent methyltransferase [Candidatus Acidoferrales bacterium]